MADGFGWCSYCGFVHNTFGQALAVERAVVGLSAIAGARVVRGVGMGGENFRIVAAYDCGHVAHALCNCYQTKDLMVYRDAYKS